MPEPVDEAAAVLGPLVADAAAGAGAASGDLMRQLLGIRDARVFLAGWTLSQFGDWALIIVLAIWAKALTDSNASAGLVFFALAAPSIFSPLAGLVVDRVRRRPLLVGVYSIEAVAYPVAAVRPRPRRRLDPLRDGGLHRRSSGRSPRRRVRR